MDRWDKDTEEMEIEGQTCVWLTPNLLTRTLESLFFEVLLNRLPSKLFN